MQFNLHISSLPIYPFLIIVLICICACACNVMV